MKGESFMSFMLCTWCEEKITIEDDTIIETEDGIYHQGECFFNYAYESLGGRIKGIYELGDIE